MSSLINESASSGEVVIFNEAEEDNDGLFGTMKIMVTVSPPSRACKSILRKVGGGNDEPPKVDGKMLKWEDSVVDNEALKTKFKLRIGVQKSLARMRRCMNDMRYDTPQDAKHIVQAILYSRTLFLSLMDAGSSAAPPSMILMSMTCRRWEPRCFEECLNLSKFWSELGNERSSPEEFLETKWAIAVVNYILTFSRDIATAATTVLGPSYAVDSDVFCMQDLSFNALYSPAYDLPSIHDPSLFTDRTVDNQLETAYTESHDDDEDDDTPRSPRPSSSSGSSSPPQPTTGNDCPAEVGASCGSDKLINFLDVLLQSDCPPEFVPYIQFLKARAINPTAATSDASDTNHNDSDRG